jgi:hypothetical protein
MAHTAGSGNRWEPVATPPLPAEQPVDIVARPSQGSSSSRVRRDKGLLAGLAGVLLLGGGAAGYALGHVVVVRADDSTSGRQQAPQPGLDGPGADPSGVPGQRRPGEGGFQPPAGPDDQGRTT